jgi:GrpB-like predicted nucleotidyltransferase (UPF0157 family)
MFFFRDRLRSHLGNRKLHERTKRALASREWKYTQNYVDAKSVVVQNILARNAAEKAQSAL